MNDLNHFDRDRLLQEIKELLPDPLREESQLDGSTVFVGGDPGEVIVRVSGNKVSIAEFSVRWDGPCSSVVRPKQIATLNWKRMSSLRATLALRDLVDSACETRRSKFRKCRKCEETYPPEGMIDEDICFSCAQHLGVVF